MARDGSGNYSLPANTLAVSGDPISSTKFNTLVQDLESDANVDRPIAAGGTGASTAAAARTNLGLAIGTDVQAFDAGLLSIAGLTTQADRSIYTTASDTYAVYTLTAAGRAILDDADAAAQRTTLGLGTAAVKNTGTSGDAVPLLNGTNTFSASQTVSDGSGVARLQPNGDIVAYRSGGNTGVLYLTDDATRYLYYDGTSYVLNGAQLGINGGTAWHSLNDGAGSGLDADLLDGYHVGTSGATIPLLNGNNNFSGATEISGSLTISAGASGSEGGEFHLRKPPSGSTLAGDVIVDIYANTLRIFENGGSFRGVEIDLTAQGSQSKIWTSGNDGAGSGLDADTLDGVQASAFATLAGSQTFSGANVFSSRIDANGGVRVSDGGAASGVLSFGTSANSVLSATSATKLVINSAGYSTVEITGNTDVTGTLRARPRASTETTGTLTSASANTTIQATGDITIDNSVFSAGDIIVIYAGASSRTITQGSGVTMRLGGSATTGSRTLAARGVAMLFFVSASEVVVSGGAVT